MVALWAFHLYQRRFKDAGTRKRIATLSLTMVIIGAWVAAWLFARYGVSDQWLIAVAALRRGRGDLAATAHAAVPALAASGAASPFH